MVDTLEKPMWVHPRTRPNEYEDVLVWHSEGVDRARLYGNVWRLADYGEDQLTGVVGWMPLPETSERDRPE